MSDMESVALAAAIILALGAIIMALAVGVNQAVTRGLVDDANDRASRALEIVQDRDQQPATVPSGIPLQVHSALIEGDPDEGTEWREFQVGDETRRIRVKIPG